MRHNNGSKSFKTSSVPSKAWQAAGAYGATIKREKRPDVFGDEAWHWVLRNPAGEVLEAEKTWGDMLKQLMWLAVIWHEDRVKA